MSNACNLCLEAAERPQWPRVYSLSRPRSSSRTYAKPIVGDSDQDYWISANGGVGHVEVGYTHPASIGLLHSACS